MKLRYITKNYDQKKNQIDKLREGDEICSGVIDSMSEDYLSYISNLVKNAKTPHKNQHRREPSISSEDNLQEEQEYQQKQPSNHQLYNQKKQSKIRHHSQNSVKHINLQTIKQNKKKTIVKNSIQMKNQSPKIKNRQEIQLQKSDLMAPKIKKRKIEYNNDLQLKNQQKTMSISRNTVNHSKNKKKYQEKMYQQDFNKKSRLTNKSKQRFYITAQNYEESDGENASIQAQIPKNNRQIKKLSNVQQNFIDNITQYIITLEQKDLIHHQQSSKHLKKSKQTHPKKITRQKKKIRLVDDNNYYDQHQIYQIMKQNMKLRKKNKQYEQKVELLQDQISSHLIQCKNRDKGYKNKIADLINHLTYQNQKIKEQKIQITKFKDLLRTVSQKCKQIQHSNEQESQEYEQRIGQSVIKYLGPTRYNSEMRTKNKKTLESTMPKYDQQRKFW